MARITSPRRKIGPKTKMTVVNECDNLEVTKENKLVWICSYCEDEVSEQEIIDLIKSDDAHCDDWYGSYVPLLREVINN
jgi:hypothetical protein